MACRRRRSLARSAPGGGAARAPAPGHVNLSVTSEDGCHGPGASLRAAAAATTQVMPVYYSDSESGGSVT